MTLARLLILLSALAFAGCATPTDPDAQRKQDNTRLIDSGYYADWYPDGRAVQP